MDKNSLPLPCPLYVLVARWWGRNPPASIQPGQLACVPHFWQTRAVVLQGEGRNPTYSIEWDPEFGTALEKFMQFSVHTYFCIKKVQAMSSGVRPWLPVVQLYGLVLATPTGSPLDISTLECALSNSEPAWPVLFHAIHRAFLGSWGIFEWQKHRKGANLKKQHCRNIWELEACTPNMNCLNFVWNR